MKKVYRITPNWLDCKIEEFDCVSETAKTLAVLESWLGRKPTEKTHKKLSDSYEFYDSWDAAHAALLEHAKRRVDSARRSLEIANSKYGNINGMKKPDNV